MARLDIVVDAIDNTTRGLTSAGRGIDNTESKVGKLGKAGKAAALALGGLAVAGVAAGVKLVGSFLETADELRAMSVASGASVESLQVLGRIAERTGGSAEDVADAFREMQLRLSEASTLASGPAVDALEVLGLSLSDLEGLDAAAQFDMLRDAIASVEDPSQRLFLAEELLGGSTERLQGILGATAGEFDSLTAGVEAAGGIMSTEAVESAEKLSLAIEEVKARGTDVLFKAMEKLAPVLLDFADWMEDDGVPGLKRWANEAALTAQIVAEMAQTVAKDLWDVLVPAFEAATAWVEDEGIPALKEWAEVAAGLTIEALIKLGEGWDALWANMRGVWEHNGYPLLVWYEAQWIAVSKGIPAAYREIIAGWDALWAQTITTWETFGAPLVLLVQTSWISLQRVSTAAFNALTTSWRAMWAALQATWDVVGKPMYDAIRSATSAIGSALGHAGRSVGAVGDLLGFASGGVVPGPKGAPMLAVVHGGETITPPGQAGPGGGGPIIANLIVDRQNIGQFVLGVVRDGQRAGAI